MKSDFIQVFTQASGFSAAWLAISSQKFLLKSCLIGVVFPPDKLYKITI